MSIRIQRNANGNAINFIGSSQPAYWNSCLSGQVNSDDATRVDVVNDIRTTDSDKPFYEFYGIPYTEFTDRDGNSFADASAAAAYITAEANVVGGGTFIFSASDTLDVSRDATNTNLLFSTGDSYGVNAIKAVAQEDGNITITENVAGGSDLFTDIRPASVTVGGDKPTSVTATAVVNTLNALFTVTPLGLGGVDPVSSYTTLNTGNFTHTVFGDVTFDGSNFTYVKGANTGSQNTDGFKSTDAVLSTAGEYVEYDWASVAPNYGSAFTMGFTSNTAYTPDGGEMGGLDLALRLKGLKVEENHDYGSVIENGYYNTPQSKTKFRMGLDTNKRLYISFYDSAAEEWQVAIRSAFAVGDETYCLVFLIKEENISIPRNFSVKEIDPASFTLEYRYIESPDGSFYYPLFATTEQAEWADQLSGGSGTTHSHVFADETPTQNQWHMPDTGFTHAGTSAPVDTDTIAYTEILTGADTNYTPTAYTAQTLTVDEGGAVNLAIDPAGSNWTTSISGEPAGFTLSGGNLVGTAPEVTGIIADNASDDYVITVTRSNIFGTSTGTLTLTVNNLTQTVTAISGFTHKPETITMVDSDTLEAGSVVTIDDSLEQGKRMVFSAAFIRGLFDDIANASSAHSVTIGVLKTGLYGSQWTNHSSANIQLGWRLHKDSSGNKYLSLIYNGDGISSTNFGVATFNRDLVIFHDTASNKLHLTQWGVTAGTGESMDTPTVIANHHMTPGSSDVDVTIGLSIGSSTDVDITTTGITEVDNPSLGATAWTKAVDFGGSNDSMEVGGTESYSSPLKMYQSGGVVAPNTNATLTVPNSSGSTTNPWSTACVFKPGGQGPQQGTLGGTIWGVANSYSHYHNIRLVERDGHIWFKWGYKNAENEIRIIENASTSTWYGVYIGFRGQKSATPSAAFLGQAFDIHVMSNADGWNSAGSDISTSAEWALSHNNTGQTMTQGMSATGFKMGNAFGSTGHYEFNGKIASFVVTTQMGASPLPDATEIKAMITDPSTWLADLDGTTRRSYYGPNFTFVSGGSDVSSALSTQVYLMGDGTNDSYSNNIRNQSNPTDTNYSDLEFGNMVANDIETVNIPGLS